MRRFNRLLGAACASPVLFLSIVAAEAVYAQETRKGESIQLDTVVVTGTREAKLKSEVAESIDVLDSAEIEAVGPAHPAELLNRSPGVYVNNLGGEGHMTSIRQPLTTGGVYLFLEDGIPTRPTGLFNHNGLYEINIPQADRVEVTKGPGSALYGSDSIGGVINSITKGSPVEPEFNIDLEGGSFGWKRALIDGGAPINDDLGYRLSVNATDNDGYRDESAYSRYSTTAVFDGFVSDESSFKGLFSYTRVDQSGVSGLDEYDYQNNPTKNLYHNDVGRREVEALRLSSEFNYEPDANQLWTVTPFFRDNQMKLMPSWMLSYDPNDRDYQFQSFGVLAKHRQKLADSGLELITGVDVDYTPSTYREVRLSTTQSGDIYTGTSETGRTNYDFDANQLSISPYIHSEWQPVDQWRFSAGVRYDYFQVDYTDNLDASVAQQQVGMGGFTHYRPDSQTLTYDQFSPKLGAVFNYRKNHDLYANYRHSFRVPGVGQLFRSGSTLDTDKLEPVKTDSFEIGTRGQLGASWRYEVAIYHMIVQDDIVSYIDDVSGDRKITNAGETSHQGIELGLNGDLTEELKLNVGLTFTNQEYDDYSAVYGFPATEINYGGNDVAKAPGSIGNMALQYAPGFLPHSHFEVEWEHLGSYYTDETNTQKYEGHDLFNVRAAYDLTEGFQLYARVMNITDELYSTYTSNQVGSTDVEYRPGMPRAVYLGLKAQF